MRERGRGWDMNSGGVRLRLLGGLGVEGILPFEIFRCTLRPSELISSYYYNIID